MAAGGTLLVDVSLADPHTFVVRVNHDKTHCFSTSEEVLKFIGIYLDAAFPSKPKEPSTKQPQDVIAR